MFKWLSFINLLLLLRSTNAAAQDMHFIHLTMNEGLSSDYITDVYQDSTGLYWIATHNGLNIYDGHHVHVLHANPSDPYSLPNDEIVSILPDFKGHLWIGTNGGAAKLDLKTWRCLQFKNPENLAALPNDFDNNFFRFGDTVVRQANMKFWLVDEIKNTFSILPLPEPFVNELLSGIHIQGDNAILVSYSRVAIVNLKTGSYNIPSLPSGVAIQHLLLKPYATSNPNEFWISTWGNGLWKLQVAQNKLFPFNDYASNLDKDAILFDVFEEKKSGLHEAYVSSNKGLTRLSIQDGEIRDAQRFSYKNDDVYSFRGEAKRYFRLSENEVWVASDQGINILLKRNQAVQTEESVRGNSIHFFADTISGHQVHWLCLWDSEGLFLRDASSGEVKTIKPTGEQKSEWNNVSAIDRATDGTYWVGTLRGVVHASYDGNRWIVLRQY